MLALGAAACGSAPIAELPPPAGPAVSPPLAERPAGEVVPLDRVRGRFPRPESPVRRATEDGRQVVTLDRRAREVVVRDAATGRRTGSAPAGTGPTHLVVGAADRAYVTDTVNDALLVFDLRPEPELIRRVYIPGAPYAMAADRDAGDLWIATTETNELWRYKGGYRPVRLDIEPSIRQPEAIAVRDGRVFVTGRAERVVQILDP